MANPDGPYQQPTPGEPGRPAPWPGQPGQPAQPAQPGQPGQPAPWPGQPEPWGTTPPESWSAPTGSWSANQPPAPGQQSPWTQPAAPGAGWPGEGSTPPPGQPPAWTPYPNQWPAPAPQPKRRVGLLVTAIVVPVVLVIGAVVTAGVLLANKSDSASSTGASDVSASGTVAAHASPSQRSVTLSTPQQIGSLRRSADQSLAEQMRSGLSNAGIEKPFAAVYEDSAVTGRTTVMWGGVGDIFRVAPETQLSAFIKSAGSSLPGGATVATETDVEPGQVGGKAKCAKVNGAGVTMTLCAWNGGDALIGFLFGGIGPDKAAAQMRTILSAVVH